MGPSDRIFFTDFRYTERAEQEVGEGWERPRAERELLPQIGAGMKGRVGFEDAKLSVRQRKKLGDVVPDGVELVPAGDLVEELRAVKDDEEISRIAAAAELADEVYRWATDRGLAGRSERMVAREAEARIRELGAEPSFPPIVAAAENGALPHAEPGDREIGGGELVVFDMGAELDGYCSDCTRTFATGEPGEEARAVYELVRDAQAAALGAIKSGIGGRDADAVPRELIEQAGHGDRFGHGTGHGVGLEVHEGPRLAASADDELRAGNVVTVEPGRLPPRPVRRPHRGPGGRHRGRPPQPQRPAEGAHDRRVALRGVPNIRPAGVRFGAREPIPGPWASVGTGEEAGWACSASSRWRRAAHSPPTRRPRSSRSSSASTTAASTSASSRASSSWTRLSRSGSAR